MNHTRHTTQHIPYLFEKKALKSLVVGVGILGVLYTYYIGFSIVHVVEREELAMETRTIIENIAVLEREYLHRSHGLTADVASHHGLGTYTTATYLERGSYSVVR